MPNVSTLTIHPNMSQKTIILGTAHRVNVGGNRSPNGVLREYRFSREVCKRLKNELEAEGVIELLCGLDQSQVALVDQVGKA